MERFSLNAETRGVGKGPAKKLRVSGNIPAVLYGKSAKPQVLSVNAKEVEQIMKKAAGATALIDLKVGKDTTIAVVRDYQADPFKRQITHIDFQAVGLKDRIEVEVPIRLVGTAVGTKEGGVLEQLRRSISVKCLVTRIPSQIEVDVTELDIGDNIHIDDIELEEGVEFPRTTNFTVATVVPPTKEEVPVPAVAEVPAEGVEAAEKPAEGEAPAEGAPAVEKKEE